MDASCGPKIHTVNDGDNVALNCSAIGIPAVNYTWTVNNKVSQGPTTTFVATRSLNGSIVTCATRNAFGNKKCSKTLIVYYKPDQLTVINAQGGVLYANKGQPINITCNATGNPQPDYVWSFKGKQLHSSINSTIVISNATLDDAGMYTCTAINSIGRESINVTLQVNFKPENLTVVNASKGTLDVDEGQLIDIICNADGYPDRYFLWQKSDQMIQSSNNKNNTITINNATSNDAGVYTCTAVNLVGNESISVTLRVKYISNAVCAVPASANEGDAMVLNCSAVGYPPVSYTWTTPGKIHQGPTTSISATADLNGVTVTCKATNTFEMSTCTRSLTVNYKPRNVTVSPSRLVLNETESLNLTCDASANPAGSYSWSLNGKILEGETSRMLTKHNIKIQDAGEYICTVTNSLGTDTSGKAVVDVPRKFLCEYNN
ncbi:Hemicentin-1 [Exaiptasia diaphana]|nr:Hemicentin-1 [Exaiptasia diaphana]